MALTKCVVLVDAEVDARNFNAVLRAIRDHFDPSKDFLLLPGVPFDTLDFTSLTLNVGSKMVLDATRKERVSSPADAQVSHEQLARLHPRIRDFCMLEGCWLVVQVEGEGRSVVEALVKAKALESVKLIAAVSGDVALRDRESLLWGLFTRFDPARDVVFTEASLQGSWPVYRGRMGIDATFKSGYPDPVVMDPQIIERVNQRWHQYWTA
jgi:4-hydroxy-3-polyprenylbenzoate decarboxylase